MSGVKNKDEKIKISYFDKKKEENSSKNIKVNLENVKITNLSSSPKKKKTS